MLLVDFTVNMPLTVKSCSLVDLVAGGRLCFHYSLVRVVCPLPISV
jgi:hypothetical protein